MRKTLRALLLLISGMAGFCQAQTLTTFTATITDSDSQTWGAGTWTADLYNPSSTQVPVYTLNPTVPVQTHFDSQTMSNGGQMSASMPDNAAISPAYTQWVFTICSGTSAPCSKLPPVTITGTTLDLSAQLSALVTVPRFNASGMMFGYNTTEVLGTPFPGAYFYTTVGGPCKQWSGVAWGTCGGGTFTGGVNAGYYAYATSDNVFGNGYIDYGNTTAATLTFTNNSRTSYINIYDSGGININTSSGNDLSFLSGNDISSHATRNTSIIASNNISAQTGNDISALSGNDISLIATRDHNIIASRNNNIVAGSDLYITAGRNLYLQNQNGSSTGLISMLQSGLGVIQIASTNTLNTEGITISDYGSGGLTMGDFGTGPINLFGDNNFFVCFSYDACGVPSDSSATIIGGNALILSVDPTPSNTSVPIQINNQSTNATSTVSIENDGGGGILINNVGTGATNFETNNDNLLQGNGSQICTMATGCPTAATPVPSLTWDAVGGSATIDADSTDDSGSIAITSSNATGGQLLHITFGGTYAHKRFCTITSSIITGTIPPYASIEVNAGSTTVMQVATPTATTTPTGWFNYVCSGGQ